jgi:hypothetical protein
LAEGKSDDGANEPETSVEYRGACASVSSPTAMQFVALVQLTASNSPPELTPNTATGLAHVPDDSVE